MPFAEDFNVESAMDRLRLISTRCGFGQGRPLTLTSDERPVPLALMGGALRCDHDVALVTRDYGADQFSAGTTEPPGHWPTLSLQLKGIHMRKFAYSAGALALAFMITPALAHDDDGDSNANSHSRDHQEHRNIHQDQADEHARAHEDGFSSRWQHRAYHRNVAQEHNEFHEEHPNTRHDHRRWWSYRYW